MIFQTWGDAIIYSFQQVWTQVANVLPLFVGAIVLIIVGMVVGAALAKVVEQLVRALRVDQMLRKLELERMLERIGFKLDSAMFLGELVRWFVMIAFLLAAVNTLGLTQVSNFLSDVLLYLPNVAIAAIILIIAGLIADVAERIVRASVEASGYKGALVGLVTRWSIWIFAFIAALLQLGIATVLIQTLLTGLVAALALAFGLAFGLGGRDVAAHVLERLKNDIHK